MTSAALTANGRLQTTARKKRGLRLSKRDIAFLLAATPITLVALLGVLTGAFGLGSLSLWKLPPAVIFHVLTIVPAVPLATYVFIAKKGTRIHKIAGRTWCLLMFVSAISTFFIRTSPDDSMSWIHILSVLTLISVPIGIWAAMARRYKLHEVTFLQMYVGGQLIAGSFALMPGRTMWALAFG